MEPANNDRLEGWRRLHEYLAWEADGSGGVAVSPLLVVTENCRGLIANLPTLIHDQHKVEDLDTDGHDHEADAARYGLVSRPVRVVPGAKYKTTVLLPR